MYFRLVQKQTYISVLHASGYIYPFISTVKTSQKWIEDDESWIMITLTSQKRIEDDESSIMVTFIFD